MSGELLSQRSPYRPKGAIPDKLALGFTIAAIPVFGAIDLHYGHPESAVAHVAGLSGLAREIYKDIKNIPLGKGWGYIVASAGFGISALDKAIHEPVDTGLAMFDSIMAGISAVQRSAMKDREKYQNSP